VNDHPPSGSPAAKRPPWRFLGGILLFIGLIFLGLGIEEWRYASGGEIVQGTVLRKMATSGKGRGSSSAWYVIYRFTPRQGPVLEGKDEVFPDRWRILEEGGPVEVEYLSSAPETNRVPGERLSASTYSAIGGILLLTSAVLLFMGVRKRPSPYHHGPLQGTKVE
jgi:hypothetical protein